MDPIVRIHQAEEILLNVLSLLSENEFSDADAEGRADAIREDINLWIENEQNPDAE